MERSEVRRTGDGVRPLKKYGVRPWMGDGVRPWMGDGVWPWMGDGVRGACVLCRVYGGRRSGWPGCVLCAVPYSQALHTQCCAACVEGRPVCFTLAAPTSDSVYARRAGQCPILSLSRSFARSHTLSISRSLARSPSRSLELSSSRALSLALSPSLSLAWSLRSRRGREVPPLWGRPVSGPGIAAAVQMPEKRRAGTAGRARAFTARGAANRRRRPGASLRARGTRRDRMTRIWDSVLRIGSPTEIRDSDPRLG